MSDQPSGWGPPSGQGQNPPPQPPGQPYPAVQQYPGQPQPPAQQYPTQPYPGQQYPTQPYPGQQYPPPQYAGQPSAGQPYPGPYQGPPGYPPAQPALPTGPAALDQPQYDATIGQAVVRFWKKYFVFSGRASRSEFWWWYLVSAGVSFVLNLVGNLIFGMRLATRNGVPSFDLSSLLPQMLPGLIWGAAILIGTVALAVRRLHDTNRSGWWYLMVVPTYVGLTFYVVGLASIDMTRLAEGDFGGIAVTPLIIGAVLSLIGAVGGIILIVFWVLAPNPAGARFDRRPTTT